MTDSSHSTKSGQSAVTIKPRVCCRLCLAPENECVNIYKTSAADKQPLSLKINACVQIKVSSSRFHKMSDEIIIMLCEANLGWKEKWQKSIFSALHKKYKIKIGKIKRMRREKKYENEKKINGNSTWTPAHIEMCALLLVVCPPFWNFPCSSVIVMIWILMLLFSLRIPETFFFQIFFSLFFLGSVH